MRGRIQNADARKPVQQTVKVLNDELIKLLNAAF